jgi:hypothetical protein
MTLACATLLKARDKKHAITKKITIFADPLRAVLIFPPFLANRSKKKVKVNVFARLTIAVFISPPPFFANYS